MHRRIAITTFLLLLTLALHLGAQTLAPAPLTPPAATTGLVWDALIKEITPKEGELDIPFTFAVTNHGPDRITIERIEPSCGCTYAEMPSEPWHIEPGQGGLIKAEFDTRNKYGTLTKTLLLFTSVGPKTLQVKVKLPEAPPGSVRDNTERVTNLMEASKNRQAVFQGKCANCHVKPAEGKVGRELYLTACGICHDAEHRASMVPDLRAIKFGTTRAYWEHWTRHGKPNSLMPAFDPKQGAPFTDAQINSLIDFLSTSKTFPSNVTIPAADQKAKP